MNQKNSNLIIYGNKDVYELVVFTGHSNGNIYKITEFNKDLSYKKS